MVTIDSPAAGAGAGESLAEKSYDELLSETKALGAELDVPYDMYNQTLELLDELRQCDEKTAHESMQALSYSLAVADTLGEFYKIDMAELQQRKPMVWAATLLHDIGKTKVRSELINKSNAGEEWTDDDAQEMSQHASAGAKILRDRGFPLPVIRAVAEHHGKQLSRFNYGESPDLDDIERFVRDCVAIGDFADACLNRTNSRNRDMDRQARLDEVLKNTTYVVDDYQRGEELAQQIFEGLQTVH